MNWVLLCVVIIILLGMHIRKNENSNFMSPGQTVAINGAFVLFVFLRHFRQYISYDESDLIFQAVDNWLGQLIVVTFLFYSGYGIMYSLKTKENYVGTFPKRIIKILILFDLAVIGYIIVNQIFELGYPAEDYLLAFVGWRTVGNSTWYIVAILSMYLITYLSALICKKRYFLIVVLTVLGSGAYTILMWLGGKGSHWYDTIFCYSAGLLYCLCYDRIKVLIDKSKILLVLNMIVPLLVCLACFSLVSLFGNYMITIFIQNLKAVSFALTIVSFPGYTIF